MQQLLKDMNLYHGEITGKYDQELLIAVAGYQYIANNHSTMFAVWRGLSRYHDGKEFEVDGLITKELLELANAERRVGYWNDPNVKASGLGVALTSVGVGDGIVSQIWDEGSGLLKQAWSVNPTNPKFWTETLPGYYDLAKAITNGDITLEDIKEALKEGAAEEFVVPFQDIWDLQGKVLSGKASYEESERYGRALVKAFLALTLVEGAVKSGVKISGKLSKQLSELLPKLNGGAVAVTESGARFRIPDGYHVDTPELPKTDTQRQFIDFQRQQEPWGVEGKGEIPKRTYDPSPKHDPNSGWGSPNPIPDAETGQKLLDTAYSSSKNKQLYNIYEGKLIKFQPDGETGWHPYEVTNPAKEVPTDVLRQLLKDGKITKVEYNKLLKNK